VVEMVWKVWKMNWNDWDFWFVAVKRVRPAAELASAAGLTSYMICKLMIS